MTALAIACALAAFGAAQAEFLIVGRLALTLRRTAATELPQALR